MRVTSWAAWWKSTRGRLTSVELLQVDVDQTLEISIVLLILGEDEPLPSQHKKLSRSRCMKAVNPKKALYIQI